MKLAWNMVVYIGTTQPYHLARGVKKMAINITMVTDEICLMFINTLPVVINLDHIDAHLLGFNTWCEHWNL
jgi:hypothetical protein